jgi:CubicO group peptidase (beta-lactamase class C family)
MTRGWRLVLALLLLLAALASCSTRPNSDPSPSPTRAPVDYGALEQAIEDKITSSSVSLDSVRAVLVSVDGQTRISHYRHGATAEDSTHVWSVTKSVVSTLIGIAIDDGIVSGLDDTLAELLPQHRRAMSAAVAKVTLRELMTMSAGFMRDPPEEPARKLFASGGDLVDYLLRECHTAELQGAFVYSNVSSHLVSAVLAAALQRADGDDPRSVLDYARERLFDPLEINTRPAFTKPVLDDTEEFREARFGWLTDPRGISMGPFGLRLTPPDLVRLGELYLDDGVWHGRQILPAEWVREAMAPSAAEPGYGLMWWLHSWNGHQVYAAQGFEGQMIVVVPDQRSVSTISSANGQEFPMADDALFPLLNEVVIPTIDGT